MVRDREQQLSLERHLDRLALRVGTNKLESELVGIIYQRHGRHGGERQLFRQFLQPADIRCYARLLE